MVNYVFVSNYNCIMKRFVIVCVAVTVVLVANGSSPVAPSPAEITIEKKFLYDQHTLADTYPYKDGTRSFQFDKMRQRLFTLDSLQQGAPGFGILQNRKNVHGRPANVKHFTTNEYHTISDRYGVQG